MEVSRRHWRRRGSVGVDDAQKLVLPNAGEIGDDHDLDHRRT